jgi:hypothetical protein
MSRDQMDILPMLPHDIKQQLQSIIVLASSGVAPQEG